MATAFPPAAKCIRCQHPLHGSTIRISNKQNDPTKPQYTGPQLAQNGYHCIACALLICFHRGKKVTA